jgi:hypothetical protein
MHCYNNALRVLLIPEVYSVIGLHSTGNEEFLIEPGKGNDHLCNQKNKFYHDINKGENEAFELPG